MHVKTHRLLNKLERSEKKIAALPTSKDKASINRSTGEIYTPLWNTQADPLPANHFSTITLVPPGSDIPNNGPLDEEFIRAIEENKNASTLEELNS
jgi:hypothetical protein